jgi:hypothetical protein
VGGDVAGAYDVPAGGVTSLVRHKHIQDAEKRHYVEQLVIIELADEPHEASTALRLAPIALANRGACALESCIHNPECHSFLVAMQAAYEAGHDVDGLILHRGTVHYGFCHPSLNLTPCIVTSPHPRKSARLLEDRLKCELGELVMNDPDDITLHRRTVVNRHRKSFRRIARVHRVLNMCREGMWELMYRTKLDEDSEQGLAPPLRLLLAVEEAAATMEQFAD